MKALLHFFLTSLSPPYPLPEIKTKNPHSEVFQTCRSQSLTKYSHHRFKWTKTRLQRCSLGKGKLTTWAAAKPLRLSLMSIPLSLIVYYIPYTKFVIGRWLDLIVVASGISCIRRGLQTSYNKILKNCITKNIVCPTVCHNLRYMLIL